MADKRTIARLIVFIFTFVNAVLVAAGRNKIDIADRQLACAPLDSKEAQNYLKAMYAAANYAWANRQMITHWIRESLEDVLGKSARDMDMQIVYDVAHNIAKEETHNFKGNDFEVRTFYLGYLRA